MKITRANTSAYAKANGLEPLQIDGVIDGFAWKEPDITIAKRLFKGRIIKFKPLAEWGDKDSIVYG
jgi:hypothetical protein